MRWFTRQKKNISTDISEKREVPEGLYYKTPSGKIIETDQLTANFYVSPEDDFHVRIGSSQYFQILFDNGKFKELDVKVHSKDSLNFVDSKPYKDRLKEAQSKTNLTEAIRNAVGKVNGKEIYISCMDFSFIGGSVGSAVGEKIRRAIDYCIKNKLPYVIISQSGGARMQEAGLSLMQLAKVEAKLAQLSDAGLPYISVLTDPTFGGITASYGSTGDIIIAEPGALIGFAGPRVIKETIGKDLPPGFQSSEFLLEKGFIDIIAHRKDLKNTISHCVDMLMNKEVK
ncbi:MULTISPECIES: acetyl-CoA carboxylase, carboxyltransferase subunit beta [Apibacter]|uniref:acetyl-CoA carboxylase, carboxyltransferase subunit beta n=1 Tax=Apibacter TaxID=1778601 RepID=UPI000CF9E6B9|nr:MULTISPECIES: acetyl-CoA carboxylase, carboxyltransferase subunit beta [Apibacter]MCX8677078.1 acetyl-CoA carboxylase, carboxyltransferase subunit beta [Apibacter sp. B3919]MXO24542.1 acetyl-CoA carboxylase, carboxyltransferase subunit beta [Apibacter sp. B3924]MXO25786.1 acetyl-CoA carboxylase, carboxyltransferase subunit beta [Apibacter sp. B3813]MXO27737.1 acetyl-CoA carboxylase, carboxyltransferase subunit beta [Apibacter sp. B3913]MXO29903.1 acetyl-CoA carboxylase, carboxyltransferase 